MSFQQVSRLLKHSLPTGSSSFAPVQKPLSAPASLPASQPLSSPLKRPDALFQSAIFAAPVPATSLPTLNLGSEPRAQLVQLGAKYGVPYTPDLKQYQKQVIQQVIRHKARAYGVPERIALAIAMNESGQKMWSDVDKGTLVAGRNVREGALKSTDWGVMQINDKAHPKAFPRVKTDLEYNIDYGLRYLARQRQRVQGSLNLGFGDWDRTIAAYNLGHNPRTERAYATAQRYVSHVHKRAQSLA